MEFLDHVPFLADNPTLAACARVVICLAVPLTWAACVELVMHYWPRAGKGRP